MTTADAYNSIKKWWYLPFLAYVIPNIFMAGFTSVIDLLFVDNIPLPLTASYWQIGISLILVLLSFYFIKYVSLTFNKIGFAYRDSAPSSYLGVVIFILQFFQLIVLIIFDFGRVGGVSTSSNYLVLLASYIPSDTLFLVYYGHHRKNGVPWFNLAVYLITSILQGWTGIWLILFFIEFYHQLNVIPFKRVVRRGLLVIIVLALLYPVIDKYKYILRGGEDFQAHTALESAGALMNRLQQVSGVILIYQEQAQLSRALNDNEIIPFYLDNRLGLLFSYSAQRVSMQKYLTTNYLIDRDLFSRDTDIDALGWYTNVGIAGWFLVLSPIENVFYIFFIILIIVVPFLINHYFLKSKEIIPVIQTLTIIYAFHGWFSVQLGFISGVILYVMLYNLFIKRVTNSY
ncbi:oligosaccharide repeat unit polymerase [Pedobacter africanus]|uniref:Oligosaccharide repeat unit polymerase n=1 Tax=Pedobacter africanus TaxID=151894 RepID=A0A1W2BTC5_9SPHI|nr:oligosaccharide repeat unit polymerase [Pedobacter africanus]SMC75974.1 hypothetical protein SAMN04488524_2606 [Pedobacter africanus]